MGVLPDRAACKTGGTELDLCVLVLKAGSICLCKGLQNSGRLTAGNTFGFAVLERINCRLPVCR